ncbi:polyprenol phosphomannose-dependent alpha 1,6 mannosyltransferase MptB [Longivirga aurantiaca]|uniref:Polyprenol phosphomannose-dependent alpha 1,6 mannosyltransferase MptB n=1 Tax=Longivirga aurantiaca TaxID=1837743 RepID=A0ABW1T210_9ACTN
MAGGDVYGGASEDTRLHFALRYALGGFVASTVLAIGSIGVGWLPLEGVATIPFVEAMRHEGVGLLVSRACVIVGGALLLQAWLVLGADILGGHVRDVRRLWKVLALWCAPLLFAPPLFSRDAYSYFMQGKLVLAGGDPYTQGVESIPGWFTSGVDPLWRDTPTPYGPVFVTLSRGVAALVGDNAYLAVVVFRVLALAGVALMAYYIPRLAFHSGIDGSKALWLGVMNPLVLMHFVAGVHNDAIMVGFIVAGLCLVIEGRGITGIVLVTIAAMVKPIAFLAIPFVAIAWAGTTQDFRARLWAWTKAFGVVVLTYGVIALSVGASLGWIRALTTPGEVRTWLSPATALGMASGNLLSWVGLGDHHDLTVGIFRAIGMLAAVAIVAYLLLKPEGRSVPRGMMLAFLAVVALGPVVQPWYLLWVLPLAAASGLSARELRVVLLLVAGFTIYGLWETSASADTYFDLGDGLAMIAAAVAVAIAVAISPRERALLFGGPVAHGLVPEDAPAAARRERLVVRAPEHA